MGEARYTHRVKEVAMKKWAVIPLVALLASCATYHTQYVPFRPPEGYPNRQVVSGITIGGEAFADKGVAKKAFGFDIKGSGLLPVQIVMSNAGGESLQIVPGQTFLVDDGNRYWPVVPTAVAADRVERATEMGGFFGKRAGKGAVLGATAGTVLGTALGIVSGGSVAESLGKGAALGAAGGLLIGGSSEGASPMRERTIAEDIREKGLEGKTIPPGALAHGFVFFPGEAESAREIRLQLRERESGNIHNVILKLEPEPETKK
jgi:hypothetical protein